MKKHILIAIGLTVMIVPAVAKDLRVPFNIPIGGIAPDTREIDVDDLKALVAAAEENGDKTAFVGSPTVWAKNGEISKPGVYLLNGGGITVVGRSQ